MNGEQFFGRTMLAMDSPDHTRLCGLMAKAFTTRRIERLRPHVQEITGALLDGSKAHGESDLIEGLAVAPTDLRHHRIGSIVRGLVALPICV